MHRKKILVYILLIGGMTLWILGFLLLGDWALISGILGSLMLIYGGIGYMVWLYEMPGKNRTEERKKEEQKRQKEAMEASAKGSRYTLLLVVLGAIGTYLRNNHQELCIAILIILALIVIIALGCLILRFLIRMLRENVTDLIAEGIKKSKE